MSEQSTWSPEMTRAWQQFQLMEELLQSRLGQLLQSRSNL
jgi:hypothetical protein